MLMRSLRKSAVLGSCLLAGAAATSYAQSVSNLPPTVPSTAPTASKPRPPSTAKIYPNPGNGVEWVDEHHQATPPDNETGRRPYSVPHFGPPAN
jgi:hypothetical protein